LSPKIQPITRIWQEGDDKAVYRLQTWDEAIHHYLSQRKDFTLVGWGINHSLWIYRSESFSIQKVQEKFNFIIVAEY
jgi:hypothetical protein